MLPSFRLLIRIISNSIFRNCRPGPVLALAQVSADGPSSRGPGFLWGLDRPSNIPEFFVVKNPGFFPECSAEGSRFKVGLVCVRMRPQAFASARKHSRNVRECGEVSGMPGSPKSSRSAALSSLLDLRRVFASQKCQQSRRSSRSAALSSLLDSRQVFLSRKCQ